MKQFFTIYFFTIFTFGFCQSNWMTLQTELTGEYEVPLNVIPTSNSANTETALYFELSNKGRIYRINNKQQILNEINVDKLPKRTRLFVGSCTDGIAYTLFFSNQNKTRIGSILVDFKTNSYTLNKDLIRFKEENVLANFNNKNTFYILTTPKKSNQLKLYSYDVNGLTKTQSFNLNKANFDTEIETYNLFSENITSSIFKKIDTKLPTSLEVAKYKSKLYLDNNRLILTSDKRSKHTYVIDIDLSTENYKISEFKYTNPPNSLKLTGSNSFILDNKLISILGYKNLLEVYIYNLDNKKLLKTFKANENNPIAFNNTPPQTKDLIKSEVKIHETSAQFFKELKSGDMAISGFKVNNQYIITIGSSKEQVQSNYAPFATMGALGGLTSAIIFSSFQSYYNSKSIQFKSLLDDSLNHIEGNITDNIFDKIVDFNSTKSNAIAPAIFNSETSFIWGAFGKKSGFYQMFKFDN